MLVAVIGMVVGTLVTLAITLKFRNDISVLERLLAGARKSYRTAESHANQYAEELDGIGEAHSKELLEVENRFQEAAEQQRQTEERLRGVTHDLEALRTSTKTVVAAHMKPLQKEIEQERSNVTKHITRVETAERTIKTLRQEKLELEERISELTEDAEKAQNDLSELEKRITELTDDADKAQNNISELEKRASQLTDDADEAENEITRLALEITTKDRELASLREKITELTDDADETQNEATRLALEITTKDRELTTLRARLVDATDSKRDLEKLLGETFRKAEALLKPKPNTERIIPVGGIDTKEDS